MIRDFSTYSDEELIDAFNKEVWNKWWSSGRADYLVGIHAEFTKRSFDFSAIWDEKTLSFANKIKLEDKTIHKV